MAYDECLKIDPLNVEAWYNMGVTYDLQRNYVAAVAVYNTATKINPSYQKSLINKNADIDRLDY